MEIDQEDRGDAVQSDQVDGSEGDTAENASDAAHDALPETVAAGVTSDAEATRGAALTDAEADSKKKKKDKKKD